MPDCIYSDGTKKLSLVAVSITTANGMGQLRPSRVKSSGHDWRLPRLLFMEAAALELELRLPSSQSRK